MIGIAISTRNRYDTFRKSYDQWKRYLPKGAKLVVVDDASTERVPEADYRFPYNAGIAATKNKCIQLLIDAGCDEIFLSDDDCYPIHDNWYRPYLESKVKHMSMTFISTVKGSPSGSMPMGMVDGCVAYNKPCGCLLYINKSVVEKIGGFDVDYPLWGMEHVDFSQRAFNAGLIPHPFLDVPNSTVFFHSMDYHHEASATVRRDVKNQLVNHNRARFEQRKESKEYMTYRSAKDGVVLASYFNSIPDGQRGHHWSPDGDDLYPLMESCERSGCKLVIFHDCLKVKDDGMFIKVEPQREYSPNVYRWVVYNGYLYENCNENVFMVDSTDVEVLRNPFQALNPNRLYVGDESAMKVDNSWMRNTQEPLFSIPDYRKVIAANSDKTLVNCGIVGGSYKVAMEYLNYRAKYHAEYTQGVTKSTDMAIFNYIVWKHFAERITHGIKVNTGFKRFEPDNGISLFRHK